MKKTKIMIIGMGDLAYWVLGFLSCNDGSYEIVTADCNEDAGIKKTNSALLSSFQMNYNPYLKFVALNLKDIEESAKIVSREKPDIIYNSATLQSWWLLAELPKEAYEKLDKARFGPWFPMHFILTYKLMLAVKKSGLNIQVINAAFPDLVNPVLKKIGLSPLIGIGNVDNIIPAVTFIAADQLKVHPRRLKPYFIAPHYVSYYLSRFGNTGGAPFYFKMLLDDKDITESLDVPKLLSEIPTKCKRPGGRGAHPLVAASVVKIIKSLLNNRGTFSHAPGPNGLPGGYPVIINSESVEVVVPDGLTLDDCIKINEEAQKFDGIENIDNDGSVTFTDFSYTTMKDLLGYDCKKIKVDECEARAEELSECFKRYVEKF